MKTPREEDSNLNVELCGSVGFLMRFFCAITVYAPFRARPRCSFWPAQTLLLIVILVLYHTSLGTLSVSRFNLLFFSRYLFYIRGYIFVNPPWFMPCVRWRSGDYAETGPHHGCGRPRSLGPVLYMEAIVRDYTIISLKLLSGVTDCCRLVITEILNRRAPEDCYTTCANKTTGRVVVAARIWQPIYLVFY